MMRIKLKESSEFLTMNTPNGLITREWKEVPDGTYIYKEVEVEGQEPEVPVEEPTIEEEVAPEEVPEETEEEEPAVEEEPKKKARRKRK